MYHLKQLLKEIPTRIGKTQRIVIHVGITIQRLWISQTLHMGIGTQEPAKSGIINTPIHMNQPHAIELLMPGIAPAELGEELTERVLPVGLAARTEGIETVAFHHLGVFIGDHVGTAQVILMQVAGVVDVITALGIEHCGTSHLNVVLVLDDTLVQGDPLVAFTQINCGGRFCVVLDHVTADAVVIGIVFEADRVIPADDTQRFVEAGPGDGAARPAGHVAVGIVGVGVGPRLR